MNTVADEAKRLIVDDRRKEYGSAVDSLTRVARIWSGILMTEITGPQVALCLAGLKLAREANASKRDNLVDLCGYALLLENYHNEKREE